MLVMLGYSFLFDYHSAARHWRDGKLKNLFAITLLIDYWLYKPGSKKDLKGTKHTTSGSRILTLIICRDTEYCSSGFKWVSKKDLALEQILPHPPALQSQFSPRTYQWMGYRAISSLHINLLQELLGLDLHSALCYLDNLEVKWCNSQGPQVNRCQMKPQNAVIQLF